MRETGFNWVAIMIAAPIAGSRLYNFCIENDILISNKLEDLHYGKCNIRLDHSTPEEITKLRYWINLEVNFVNNYDLKNNRPDIALMGFQDVLRRVPDHAFAHFYISQCYRKLGKDEIAKEHLDKYYVIIKKSEYWNHYASLFNI